MVHWASPLASVVPCRTADVEPEPTVKVTTLVGAVAGVGVSVVSVPVSVVGSPFTPVVGPV